LTPPAVPVFVASAPVDLRRSFDSLAAIVRDSLGRDPLGRAVYVFFNRTKERTKILWFDGTGYCLLYKRLERGVFRVPRDIDPDAACVTIDAAELALVLQGIDLQPPRRTPPERPSLLD
jgi:transposase